MAPRAFQSGIHRRRSMTLHATDPRSGFFRFLHHDRPIEYSADVDERIAYIRAEKPPAERAGRLAAILRIPAALIPVPVAEAQRASEEAHRAYIVAQRAYVDAQRAAWADGGLARALSLAPLPEGVKWDSTNTCLELT